MLAHVGLQKEPQLEYVTAFATYLISLFYIRIFDDDSFSFALIACDSVETRKQSMITAC